MMGYKQKNWLIKNSDLVWKENMIIPRPIWNEQFREWRDNPTPSSDHNRDIDFEYWFGKYPFKSMESYIETYLNIK